MSPFQSIFDQVLGTSTPDAPVPLRPLDKQVEVMIASEAKRSSMSDPDAYKTAAGIYTGNGESSAEDLERDIRTMDTLSFQRKYGTNSSQIIRRQQQARDKYRADKELPTRNGLATAADLASSTISGFVNSVGGLGALGAGAVNDRAGLAISEGLNSFNEGVRSVQSDALNTARKTNQIENELAFRDSEKQFNEDIKTDGNVVASMKRIGRDIISSTGSTLDNPMLTGDVVASGTGSLLTGGLVSSGLKKVGRVALERALASGAVSAASTVAPKIVDLGAKASMPAAIGAMEAGGAYQQTVTEAYERLRDRTDLTEDEKIEMAGRAGLMAAAIQAPVGAATGALVAPIERAPFAPRSIGMLASNILKETLEEGIQSGSGQAASNYALSREVSPDQEISQGVGEQIAQGMIGGAGSAGVVQAPGTALKTTVDTSKMVGRTTMRGAKAAYGATIVPVVAGVKAATKPIGDFLIQRYERMREEAEKVSPVSDEVIRQQADEIEQVVQAPAPISDLGPELQIEANQYLGEMTETLRYEEADFASDPELQSFLSGSKDRVEAASRIADLINRSEFNDEQQIFMGSILEEMLVPLKNVQMTDPEFLNKIPENHPLRDYDNRLIRLATEIQQNPKIARAQRAFNASLAKAQEAGVIQPISDAEVGTPEGQRKVQIAVAVAENAPDKADPDVNEKILYHAERGDIRLSPNQMNVLRSSSSLVQAQRSYNERADQFGMKQKDFVSKEILNNDGKTRGREKSALQHMKDVAYSYRAGNIELAKAHLDDFLKFAQHMQNKVGALNTSFNRGGATGPRDAVQYQLLHPTNREFVPSFTGLYINPTRESSIELAQEIYNEAKTVAEVANSLVDAFPDLGSQKVQIAELNPSLIGTKEEVFQRLNAPEPEVQEVPETVDVRPEDQLNQMDTDPQSQNNDDLVDQDPDQVEVDNPSSEDAPVVEDQISQNENIVESEPEVETSVQSEPVPEKEKPKQGIDAVYPKLAENSRFKKAFKLPVNAKSRLTGSETPLQYVRDVLKNRTELGPDFSVEISKAYQSLLNNGDELLDILNQRLEKFFNEPTKKGSKETRRDQFLNDPRLVSFNNGKALNIVNEDLAYDPELIEGAVLAGLQWIANSNQYGGNLDVETAADILGIDETNVTDLILDALNEGMTTSEAARSLASKIRQYWGLTENKNAPKAYWEGVPEAIAKEMILSFVEMGWINTKEVNIAGTDKSPIMYIPQNDFSQTKIAEYPDAIERAVLIDPELTYYVGEIPSKISETQLRNDSVENTTEQKEVLKKVQAIPYYIDNTIVNLYEDLGLENVVKIFGGGDNSGRMNEEHRKTIEGKNRTIGSAFNSLDALLKVVRHKAEVSGTEVDQLPIYYASNFTRVNRMQMLGKDNPQASKLVREAVLPTRVTLDMTTVENQNRFMLGLAQALSIKVHTMNQTDSFTKLFEKLNGPLSGSVEMLQGWLNDRKTLDAQVLADAGLDPMGLHALTDYARYLNSGSNSRTEFTTSIYVEADGVTNGPINAMMLFTSGAFTEQWIENIQKGGLLFTPNQSMNDYRYIDTVDLYQSVSNVLNRQGKLEANELFSLMENLGIGVSFDGSNILVDRGVVKNPLTITLYGSGARGIAGNIADEILSNFYQQLTKSMNGSNTDLNPMFDALVSLTGLELNRSNLEKFKLSKDQYSNLVDSVLDLFVEPLREAIQETVSPELSQTVEVLRKVTQTQSIFYEYAYKREIERILETKEIKSDFLSQNELDSITDRLKHLAPYYTTGSQNFMVSKDKRYEMKQRSFGNSLDNQMSTPASIYTPGDAGVSGIPFMTIGNGDGQAIQNAVKLGIERAIFIYDGIHLSLDRMQEDSTRANEAVYQSWMQNPLRVVADGYAGFMKDVSFKDMSEDQLKALGRALFDPTVARAGVDQKQIFEAMKELAQQVSDMSESIEARHQAINEVAVSIDQMAAVGAPYQNNGNVLSGSNEDIARELNKIYNQKLKKKASASEDISSELQKVGRLHKSGARVLSFTAVRNLIKMLNIPMDQRAVLGDIMRAVVTKDYKIVLGNREQIEAYAEATGNYIPADNPTNKGFTVFGDKTIYLQSATSETLLHELIHAATYEKVDAFYSGQQVDEAIVGAVERTEALMDQFLKLDMTEIRQSVRNTYELTRNTIQSLLNQDNKAAALNEFMAWGLSNQDLVRIGKRTEATPISRLVQSVIDALKKLIFGRKQVNKPAEDMFSNLRWNTNIIIRSQPTVAQVYEDTVLYQNGAYGNNDRLVKINQTFNRQVAKHLKSSDLKTNEKNQTIYVNALQSATRVMNSMNAHGFPMTMQERSTFQAIVGTLATEAQIDPAALNRAQELYAHVTKNLKVEDLMDPQAFDEQQERFYAQEKYDSIMGNFTDEVDAQNRSTLLSAFLALSIVSDQFRDVLRKMPVPKTEKNEEGTVDALLENAGNKLMDALSARISGEDKAPNIQAAVDALSEHIMDVAQDRQSFAEQVMTPVGNAIDKANIRTIQMVENLSDRLIERDDRIQEDDTKSKLQKNISQFVTAAVSFATEKNGTKVTEGLQAQLNAANVFPALREIIGDFVGRTSSNALVYDMIKTVNSLVSQVRQQYREHLPETMESKFTRKVTDREKTAMFMGMAKTDLAGLRSGLSMEEILQILQDPEQADRHINDAENRIKDLVGKSWSEVQKKSKQLAKFMGTGEAGSALARNANAIAKLYAGSNSSSLVNAIDQLVSLYAYERMNDNTKTALSSLAQNEVEGVTFALSYLVGQRAEEVRKAQGTIAEMNGYKGYIPSENQQGVSLIIADNGLENYDKLTAMSFQQVGQYKGSNLERGAKSKSYYFAPVSGKSIYNQGIIQNARMTANGVDLSSGFSSGMMTAGVITEWKVVDRIARMIRSENQTEEPLLPIYDNNGKIIAFERAVDPKQLIRLNKNTDLFKMIGAWRGRQAEELHADEINLTAIDRMYQMYKDDLDRSKSNENQYIDLFDDKVLKADPILADAMKLVNPATREYIREKFGASFMVRRDMLNDVVGYRSASLTDPWSGTSRWSEENLSNFRKMVVGAFGPDAYKNIVKGERAIQAFMSELRTTIVVRSVIVPVSNLLSNVKQLAGRGVPIPFMLKAMPRKLAEVDSYVKGRLRQIEAEAELRAAEGDPVATRKLETEIKSITDAQKRLTIWPLIEAGEFTSISDGNVTKNDIDLTEGRLGAYIENLVDKLPGPVRTAGKYALITKDTALYQGLQKSVQYGDFIAKAIMFEDMTNRQKRTKEEALAKITEEFVNYDRLPGRFRGYLESMGLLWFWNFKIRSAKIAVSMIRNNPVHMFMTSLVPAPTLFGSIGTPLDDNMFTVAAEGRLDNSMGPGQGFRGFALNPWVNLVS